MAKIFYSMAGEGRGHAVRVRTLAELLRRDHELHLFAPDDAFEFLSRFYDAAGPSVRLLRIPGLRFHYTSSRLDLTKSIFAGLKYAGYDLHRLVRALARRIELESPDLVITDFEPALPRAARRVGVPVLSLDHQYMLRAYDLSTLPGKLQRYAWAMSFAVWLYYHHQQRTVVSSFYTPPLKAGWENVTCVGPMIRDDVARQTPVRGDFLLSYLRKCTPLAAIEALKAANMPVKVYGLGERPPEANLTFRPISEVTFVEDLAGCRAVISAAGNQLLGESLYLGKPFFAIPEKHHHEQLINAHFLRASGAGDWTTLETFGAEDLRHFLSRLDEFDPALGNYQGKLIGNHDAVRAVTEALAAFGAAPTDEPKSAEIMNHA
jgi:uncharacterized protein (TIGR00661 family)